MWPPAIHVLARVVGRDGLRGLFARRHVVCSRGGRAGYARRVSNFERLYASPLHDPLFFWFGAAIFVIVLASRLPFLAGFLVVFAFEIAADATLTGALSPIPKGAPYGTPISVAFVILGDFRYFVLVERFAARGRARVVAFGAAALWAFLVPVIAFALRSAVPSLTAPPRVTWLTYEVLFLVLALALRFALIPRRTAGSPPDLRRWLLDVTAFEIAQYALWALSDVLILSGVEAGFLLRFVPNAMYYVLFLPFVLWRAPPSLRAFRAPHVDGARG